MARKHQEVLPQKSPVLADSASGNLTEPDKLVHRRFRHSQEEGHLCYGQYVAIQAGFAVCRVVPRCQQSSIPLEYRIGPLAGILSFESQTYRDHFVMGFSLASLTDWGSCAFGAPWYLTDWTGSHFGPGVPSV